MKLTPWDPDLRSIVDRIHSDDLDLQPDFQRQEVWTTNKKRKLIDTILRGWSIPPVHLVVRPDGLLEVLDGQQRLATIRDFYDNVFSIDGRITPYDSFTNSLDGMYYRDLSPSNRRQIDQYSLRCFRLQDYLPDEPSELFYRLNQPTMLTAGEQRNALYGKPREQLKSLVALFEKSGNERGTIGFSNARLAYDDVIARLLYFLERRTFALKSSESLITERFRENKEFSEATISQASNSIRLFSLARQEREQWKLNKASLLSILIFFSRFSEMPPGITQFSAKFFGPREVSFDSSSTFEALKIFRDRASLRVTDVSSVVLRDFCLWYCYVIWDFRPLPDIIPILILRDVQDLCRQRDDVSFEQIVNEKLPIEEWGRSL